MQAETRRILGDMFEYNNLVSYFSDTEIERYRQSISKQFSPITKMWDDEKNTIWVLRAYLSIKMIFSSTVMLSSAEYGSGKNIKIAEPYLLYYALLNCCRAVIFTLPTCEWKDGALISPTHKKIINIVIDIVKKIKKEVGNEFEKIY